MSEIGGRSRCEEIRGGRWPVRRERESWLDGREPRHVRCRSFSLQQESSAIDWLRASGRAEIWEGDGERVGGGRGCGLRDDAPPLLVDESGGDG